MTKAEKAGGPALKEVIIEWLARNQNPEQAADMSVYMKDQFKFYGIKSPARKAFVRDFIRSYKELLPANFKSLVTLLWRDEHRECQYIAMEIMGRHIKYITADDLVWVEDLIIHKSWWDTVDYLASTIVGYIFKKHQNLREEKIEYWISSGMLWLQRTALLYQLKYGQQTDEEILFRTIRRLTGGKEFFINKAIGWALRQYSKYNPQAVRQFVDTYQAELSGLSIREASKYL